MSSRTQMLELVLLLTIAGAGAYMLSSPITPARFTGASCSRFSTPMRARMSGMKLRMMADDESDPEEKTEEKPAAAAAPGGTFEFYTRPRTTNANWGTFFEIATKDSPVWITGLRAGGHSFASYDEYMRLDVKVLTKEGTCVGFEKDEAAWTKVGAEDGMRLPRIEVGDSFAHFTALPFDAPVKIDANSVQGFCIHTNKKTGLALRRKLNFDSNSMGDPYFKDWVDGVTDEGEHLKVIAGLTPGQKLFEEVSEETNARAFVGVIDYSLSEP
mmetsp:Transcript_56379/g.115325  ORF Transcript_56379/g.115325 Transcript_56379/m.115325 type:complete len:271 (+) Transcript_56379:157-969(+)|eukprot:CAMPEP_0181345648 /NCGR_PEP_ID=MMETSP1101-20121128/32868_1 /TAXON_ID=46948 /ORGANISM="Rhodomonas abbreviata, Strain Caron Lab Isolate" /LENGTH=270 /DNA_ID=CAMNT_0023457631 /DNA_START=154 /DNA_END=966 /DNA_ORIENTATION=-